MVPEIEALAAMARLLYEQRLKATLERERRGEFVAIEPTSGDYFLGRTMGEASDRALASHPDRLHHVLRIGYPVTVEIGGLAP
jgi:hypothetical protein